MSSRSTGAAVGIAALAAVCGGCVEVVAVDGNRHVDRIEKRFKVAGRPELTLSTFDGSVEVRPWDRSEVLIVVERRAGSRDGIDSIDIEADQDGDRIRLAARRQPEHAFDWSFRGRSASLIVSVPADSDLQARTGDGALDVEGLTGRVDLRSGDGTIRGRHLAGELKISTGDGPIHLTDASGSLSAQTGDGSVNVEGSLTTVRVHTGDGTVTMTVEPGSETAGDWTIATGDGSVTLELPDDFSAELDAHTGDGRISVEDLRVNVSGRLGKNRLRGQLGEGGVPLRIRTGDGSITLRRR
jgi:hypothetical protein